MAVKPGDLTPNAWAVRAGVSRTVWADIRRHNNPTRRTLEKLLDAIGMSPGDFEARLTHASATVRTEVRGTGMAPHEVQQAWALPQARPVPLLGTAFGKDVEGLEDIETTELRLAEVLDNIPRPPSIANDEDAYAVTVIGDSMAPRFEPGEIVFVSPRSTAGIGDDVIVQLRAAPVDDDGQPHEASDFADRITDVLIKRLVRRSGSFVELRQFNPDKTFRVPADRVGRIHRVKGRL
jgi:hypothetical protein